MAQGSRQPLFPSRPWLRPAWGAAVTLATAWVVFLLPFHFPSSLPVSQSSAYLAGASNAPAEIGAGLLSLLVAFAAYFTSQRTLGPHSEDGPPRAWLLWALGLHSAVLLLLGVALVRFQQPFGEAQYFLTQLTRGLGDQALYRDIAFAYGPLLYAWPLACIRGLAPLHIPAPAAYVVATWTIQMGGIALLYWVVRALPMRGSLQRLAFVLIAFGALSPTLGPNYCLLRFMLAPALALLVARQPTLPRALGVTLAGTLLALGISSECGVALLGAVCALAALHLLRRTEAARSGYWLALPAAALAAAGLFRLAAGADGFRMIANAGHGGYDLLLTPEPRTLLLLVAAVGLAPLAAARAARASLLTGGPVVALYGAALGVLPVALGRADSVHEYFFGLPAALLSLVALETHGRFSLWRRAWIAALVLWTAASQVSNGHLYGPRLRQLTRGAMHPTTPPPIDLALLQADLHGRPVFVQCPLPQPVLQQMQQRGMLAPAYFAGFSSVWEQRSAERIVREMRTAGYALTDRDPMAEDETTLDAAIARWRHFGLHYRQVHPRFDPGSFLDHELQQHWQKVDDFGDTALYRRVS